MSFACVILVVEVVVHYLDQRTACNIQIATNTLSTSDTFTQTLSHPAENGPTHQVEITKFVEAEPEVVLSTQTLPSLDYLKTVNPYPKVDLTVLRRKYRVATFQWSATVPGNLILNFPETLNNVTYIADILQTFKYMNAGVELEIRINSTQFHFGALMVSWIPNTNSNTDHSANIVQQSGNHPVVLSASTQNSATIKIPYINPDSFYIIAGSTSNIAKVFITPLTVLGLATENLADTVEVQIFASFTDPLVAGYLALPTSKKKKSRPAPLVVPRMVQQSGNVDRGSVRSEAAAKAASNSEVGISGALTTATKLIESIPIIGGAVQQLASILTILDKPLNAAPSQPYSVNMARDWSCGEGVDSANSLSIKKLPCLSDKVQLMGNVTPMTTIQEIIRVPMIRLIVPLTNTLTEVTIPVRPLDFDPGVNSADYLNFVARHFGYWAGSIKYFFCFYTSPFVSCRFKISALYQTPIATTPDSGDIASTIVDVKGDTVFSTCVPYLHETMMMQTLDWNATPVLHLEAISPMVGQTFGGTEPTIQLVIWRAAGEDMKFAQLVERLEWPSVKEEKKSLVKMRQEMDPQAVFRNTFEPIVFGCQFVQENGIVRCETVDTINEACKRYVAMDRTIPAYSSNTYPNSAFGGAFHSFSNIFKYWRGGRRVKLVVQAASPSTINNYVTVCTSNPQASLATSNGATYCCPVIWPVLEFEVPWYATRPFHPVTPATQVVSRAFDFPAGFFVNSNNSVSVNGCDLALVSAAEDFQFGWLIAPNIV